MTKHAFLLLWLMGGLLLGLAGCGWGETATAIPTAEATPPTAPPPTAAPSNPAEPSPTPSRANKLIVWMIPSIAPRPEIEGGQTLANQLAIFGEQRPGLEVVVELKTATGQGSIISYLDAGRPVAPSVMPDLILLPADQLSTAVNEGLIYPLEPLLPVELIQDLYPVGQILGQFNNTLYGYPYAFSGLTHLVYDRNTITTTVPARWSDLNQTNGVLVLPANGKPGSDVLLQLYLAQGGTLVDDNNLPHLEVEPLVRALRLLATSQQQGLLLPQSNVLSNIEEAWLVYQTSKANLTLVTVSHFLRARGQGNQDGFAAVPGLSSPLAPRVTGWVWAISTADPTRQAHAAELIQWLVSPANHAEWSQQSLRLPSRYGSMAEWPRTDPYIDFLAQELERAQPYPLFSNSINEALRQTLTELTSPTGESPDVLAEQAAQNVRP